ncbi:MAG: pilus assembly protein PilM [Clostridium sp.]|nr:pilus assembly protein PilM [Clostridium sp.]MCM1400226.1 pilus assembly protein PilM [Clostridium sp.]MCM1460321.1 pilus assembly protein PilM [Bacteroides sp.]
MAKINKVLSIDITNESITIIELTASQKKQTNIHNVIIFETPEDAYEDGIIKEPDRIAAAIRDQLSSRGISNKNAIFVLSSTKIVNREVIIPFVKENKIRGIINANSQEYFPVNIEDYVVSHSVLETVTDEENNKQLRVLAVAAPAQIVKSYYDLASMAGLNVVALDYIGNSMLQLIKTQTAANTTTMVIQLGSEATVLNIVQGDNLLLQRTVPYGTNSVVNVVMDDKGVDATTAMTLLQNDRMITVDFDDNEATGAFRYLINNIGRVMDYYASKNPDKPIDDVFLTGDGALIKGIDGLFKIQLNVNVRIMDSLYNIKFDPSIDLKVYNPVYLVAPIGAAFAPMGFETIEAAAKGSSGEISLVPFVALVVIAAIGAAGLAFYSIKAKSDKEAERDNLNTKIAGVADIEQIITEHDQAQAELADITAMYMATYQLNENMREFITQLENKIPTTVTVSGFSSANEGVSMPCVSTDYDSIADFIVQLKTMDCIEDAYVASIAKRTDEGTQTITYEFTVTCVYTNPYAQLLQMMEEEAAAAEAGATEETTESAE